MRRFADRLFAFCTTGSLVLCAGVLLLWPRSYDTYDDVHYTAVAGDGHGAWAVQACSIEGTVILAVLTFDAPVDPMIAGFSLSAAEGNSRLWSWAMASWGQLHQLGKSRLGFGAVSASNVRYGNDTEGVTAIAVPHWFLGLCLAAMSSFGFVKLWRRARRSPGRCPACGYDLRASPGRCPECGADPIVAANGKKSVVGS